MSGSRQHRASAIDEAVEAYEAARGRDGRADLEGFLPEPAHPLYLAILCELVRVDLEYGYEETRTTRLEDYERRFPQLFRDPALARELAFEEFRLRRQAGESPSAEEYRERYGVDHLDRPATGPDPDRDYRTAAKIQEDLWKHLDSLFEPPPEPSTRQRPRGRPRLALIASIVAVILASIAALAVGVIAGRHRIERVEAHDSLDRLTAQVREAGFLLGVPEAPRPMIDEGIALCREAVNAFGAGADPQWLARPPASQLSEADRTRLRREMGDILGLWARSLASRHEVSTDRRAEQTAEVERLIALAEASYGSADAPRDLKLQSAALARLAGRDAEADRLVADAEAIPSASARERLVLASTYLGRGMDREALALAEEASRLDPLDFSAWLIRGHCLEQLGQNERADQSFSLGIALRPGFHWAYFHRGRVALERRDFDRALADFARVLEAIPDQPDALLNRALAKLDRGDAPAAIADLDRVLARADAPTRALFIRSRAHHVRGDRSAAEADLREGIARVPHDEVSWVTRGLNRVAVDPASALEDFRAARKLNPKSLRALQGEASVLSETLGRTEEAIEVLDQALAYHPQSVAALTGRAVLLARLGRRDDALKDSSASLSLDDSAATLYKAGCIFALTSRKESTDRGEALRLLALAIRKDDAWLGKIDADPDLAPLRDRPEFGRLRDALRLVCPPAAPPR